MTDSVARIQQIVGQIRIEGGKILLPNYLSHPTGFFIVNPSVISPTSIVDLENYSVFSSTITLDNAESYLNTNWLANGWDIDTVPVGKQISTLIRNSLSIPNHKNIILVRGSHLTDDYTVVLIQTGEQGNKVFNDLLISDIRTHISDPSLWSLDSTRGWWRNRSIPHAQEGNPSYFSEFLMPLEYVKSIEKVTATFQMSNSSDNMLYRLFIHFMVGNTSVKSIGLRDSWTNRENGIRIYSDSHSGTTSTSTNYVATLTGTVPEQYKGQITSVKMEASKSNEYGRTPAGIKDILFQTTFDTPF